MSNILNHVEKPLKLHMNRGTPIYLPQRNVVLLPVFKCGYTSTHAAYSPVGKLLGSFNDLIEYEGVEKITLVRNPWQRLVSLWTCENNRDRLHEYSSTFEQFVENVQTLLNNGFKDGHYSSLQANLSISGRFMPDKVFKLEELQDYVDYIGLDVQFPKKNVSSNKAPYWAHYTEKAKRIVDELYAWDIERFEYKYEG